MALGQAKTAWEAGYSLSVLDFQAEPPLKQEGPGHTFYLAATLDFIKLKSMAEFRQIKNFNRTVKVYFIPTLSWLNQGEGTEILLKYAQMDFDLMELYARKFRQQLYLKKKEVNSPKIFPEVYLEIKAQMAMRHAEMIKAFSESDAKGDLFHRQILLEIGELADFCQECQLPNRNY